MKNIKYRISNAHGLYFQFNHGGVTKLVFIDQFKKIQVRYFINGNGCYAFKEEALFLKENIINKGLRSIKVNYDNDRSSFINFSFAKNNEAYFFSILSSGELSYCNYYNDDKLINSSSTGLYYYKKINNRYRYHNLDGPAFIFYFDRKTKDIDQEYWIEGKELTKIEWFLKKVETL